jgi:putative Mg2+ transporter-C (MgtC) family protein
VQVDVTRIASYVAAGVGFIGGGVILKHVGMVKGITTATSLWCAAAVGLAAGLGFWSAAVGATAIGLLALAGFRPLNRLAGRVARSRAEALIVQLEPGASLGDVMGVLDHVSRRNIKQLTVGAGVTEGAREIRADFWDSPEVTLMAELLDRLTREPSVRTAYHQGRG